MQPAAQKKFLKLRKQSWDLFPTFTPIWRIHRVRLPRIFPDITSSERSPDLHPPNRKSYFLTISIENDCDYCVAAHSMMADKVSGVPMQALKAIREGDIIQDARLAALSTFTRRLLQSRGRPVEAEVKEFLKAGFKEEQILEVVLAIAVKTISNYANHLFNTKIDSAFESYSLN